MDKNVNCLAGMRCPHCGSLGPFHIVARATFTVFDDGTDGHGSVEWDDDSFCSCGECGTDGEVGDFKESDKNKEAA